MPREPAFEQEALAFHQKLRAAFRAIAEAEPGRCVLVDATAGEDAVAAAISAAVDERLAPGRGGR